MEMYPDYFHMDINKDFLPKMTNDHQSYARYIESLFRLWCKENDIMYVSLMASLYSAVLQGNIVVEKKNKERMQFIQAGTRAERSLYTYTPSDFLYNLYNKYNVPLSDYSEMEFMLGHKNYILEKLGSIDRS